MPQNDIASILSKLGGNSGDMKEIQGGLLKIRGKTLIFGDSIYQIPNISVVEVTTIKRQLPNYVIVIFLVGAAVMLYGTQLTGMFQFWTGIIGFTIIIASLYLLVDWYYINRLRTGLRIVTNAGAMGSILIIDPDHEFLKQVALTLRNIMDSADEAIVANISIDSRKISVEGITDATVVMDSKVSGDIVNNV